LRCSTRRKVCRTQRNEAKEKARGAECDRVRRLNLKEEPGQHS